MNTLKRNGRFEQILSLIFGLFICACNHTSDTHSDYAPPSEVSEHSFIEIDLAALQGKQNFPSPRITTVSYDRAFKSKKQYEGYPFLPILEKLIDSLGLDPIDTQIKFVCKDGYVATNTVQELLEAGGGFLAFRDLDAKEGQNWTEDKMGKFDPYYLVWEDISKDNRSLVWPFGVTHLRIHTQDPFADLFPTKDSSLEAGFSLYKISCLKCHTLNGIGGMMGPEFNVPKNITEYWTRENIIAFAQNPQSFRANSTMHAIHLSTEEMHKIVDYLEYMANHKIP